MKAAGAGLRHGIALDNQVTIILSQGDEARPLCGIYFNLHSPYQKNALPKTVKPFTEKSQKTERLRNFRRGELHEPQIPTTQSQNGTRVTRPSDNNY